MIQRKYGRENTVALLTDTLWEDDDNYRFLDETMRYLRANLITVNDGRTPPDVWMKARFLVGAGGSPCTTKLKIEQTRKFINNNPNQEMTLYFGINADEDHRTYALENRYGAMGVKTEFPLCEEPMHHLQMVDLVEKEWGIKVPRMYKLGFHHANCGGRCVKAGAEHYRLLLNVWPDRFKEIEEIEKKFQGIVGKDITILRVKVSGEEIKYPLWKLREDNSQNIKLNFCNSETPCECMY
jgi:3'-phosphoadenosine 5'-phosphosulfate sulfotransferase (PAPS reductase)/FAD synthetase